MKWKNKGHEYDKTYSSMKEKQRFYLFGAGDYGNQFFHMFQKEIDIAGYIDNDKNKQGTRINGFLCYALEDIVLDKNTGIVVTMSQIARVEAMEQLNKRGGIINEDYYIIEEFISVYYAYKYDKVYFSSISFLPSTVCNLNCANCLNFNPFASEFHVREWGGIIRDVNTFFSCVDYVMLFHVSGGEPFLYKYIADLIEYIDKTYGSQIGTLRTVTNGTVIPKDEVLQKLSRCNVEITVDDYREAIPKFKDKFELLIQKLNEYGIKYYINKADAWIDLAPERTDYRAKTEEWLVAHRDLCKQSWQELRGGKLYNCNYAAYAAVAGIAGEEDTEETYNLNDFSREKTKELIEFRLGYTEKGYTDFCKKCRGFTIDNTDKIKPAVQVEG